MKKAIQDQGGSQSIAETAITQVLARYCRAMDRNDEALGYMVWHEDGVASYRPGFVGSGRDFVDRVCRMHRDLYTSHVHRIGTPLIVVDSDRAESEVYVQAMLWSDREGGLIQTTIIGRYLDRWSRRAGGWRIDHREYVHQMDTQVPIEPGPLYRERKDMSARDRTDPSYAFPLLASLS